MFLTKSMSSLSEALVFCENKKHSTNKKNNRKPKKIIKNVNKNKQNKKYKDFDLWSSGQAGQGPFQIE